jgi:excisionase family DNA binding protein
MSEPILPNPPLTVREVATHLSITEDVTRYLLRTKKLIGFKAGGQWRIPPESLTEYVVSQLAKQ